MISMLQMGFHNHRMFHTIIKMAHNSFNTNLYLHGLRTKWIISLPNLKTWNRFVWYVHWTTRSLLEFEPRITLFFSHTDARNNKNTTQTSENYFFQQTGNALRNLKQMPLMMIDWKLSECPLCFWANAPYVAWLIIVFERMPVMLINW